MLGVCVHSGRYTCYSQHTQGTLPDKLASRTNPIESGPFKFVLRLAAAVRLGSLDLIFV